jgi:hypothetical protein
MRSTILTFYVGCFDSSNSVLVYFQLLHDKKVAGLFSISLIYFILGVTVIIRTLFLVPAGSIPMDLDDTYEIKNETIAKKIMQTNRIQPGGLELNSSKIQPVQKLNKLQQLKEIFCRLDTWTGKKLLL